MTPQDTIQVFPTPVDSVRVAAQDVTSEQITNLLDFTESLSALWNLLHIEYIFFVCVSYYIVVTRIKQIKANSIGRRNLLIGTLTIFWGLIGYFWRGVPVLNLLVTGLCVNAAYEFIFKSAFRALERFGITPLPEWRIEEVKAEKQKEIERVEKSQIK